MATLLIVDDDSFIRDKLHELISGLSNEADATALLNLGAFAYFAKPFKLEDIEQAGDRAIAQYQTT
jgi:CheY-like chemotaxis protein